MNDGKTNEEIGKESADLLQDQKHVNADTRSADEVAADADQDKTPEQQAEADKNAGEAAPTDQPVPDQDKQEAGNDSASKKPGEARGRKTKEQKAAEKDPDSARKTNPVGEATEIESKDPYAEGKHIANPEPNNGNGEDKK